MQQTSSEKQASYAQMSPEARGPVQPDLERLFAQCPIPVEELLQNLPLFISKTWFSRMLYMHELYRKILDVPGVVMEFGVRWGQNLALFETFRGIYEPFNQSRKIVGFDTFEGFPSVHEKDGDADHVAVGAFSVTDQYEKFLHELLALHEKDAPNGHIRKFELIKGDASVTIDEYLSSYPETIISLAYFDLDLYEPTKKCLEAIQEYITRGTVIAFDELNTRCFPGETRALREVLGLDQYRLVHSPFSSSRCYLVVD